MIRGLNLTLASLAVASLTAGSALAFTPAVGPVPDIIVGDRTPGNTSASNDLPSDPFTHADTLEFLSLGEADNVYSFPDAINIFSFAADEPNGVPGFTSDEDLIYQFFASSVFPAGLLTNTPGDDRISINNTRISTSAFTTVSVAPSGLLTFKDEAFSADADNNAPTGTPPSFSYVFSNTAGSETVSTGTTTPDGTVTVLNQVAMTVRVTNSFGASASDEFLVTTVEEGPDAISGLVAETQNVDLSAWSYNGSANAATAFGPNYPGDAQATGLQAPDSPSDGSVNDLQLTTGTTDGDFFHAWASPAGLIPFVQDGTYHIAWNVSSTIGTGIANPVVRFRWGYSSLASLGGGNVVADGSVAPASAGGRNYYQMFDHLDVGSVTGTIPTILGGDVENTVRLFWENYDFDGFLSLANIGGGQTELQSVEISRLNRAALLALAQSEVAATDYTSTALGTAGPNFGGAPNVITVTRTTTNFTITSPVPTTPGTTAHPYGADQGGGNSNLFLNDHGLGFIPVAPSSATGRAYRLSADVDTTANSTTSRLPRVTLAIASFTAANAQLYTSTVDVEAITVSSSIENPAANGLNNYAAYLRLPEGGDLSGGAFGARIGGNVRLTDFNAIEGGSVTVTNLEISSFPEALLP